MRTTRRRMRRRGRALVALAIVVVIAVVGTGASVFAYTLVRDQAGDLQAQLTDHLQKGQAELEAAKASLQQANAKHDETLVGQANTHFTAAKAEFIVAGNLADGSAVLKRLEGLPAVGRLARSRHQAVDGIAAMGVAISDAGLELANLDGQLIKPPGGQEARTLLTVLDQTHTSLVKVRADFDRAQKAASRVDVQALPVAQQGTLAKARGTLTAALAGLDEFERLVPILTEMMGGNGVRTYLIEQVNPAELRAGGGFIGTYSVLQADHGTLKLIASGDAAGISYPRARQGEVGYVAPPGPLREALLDTTSWSFDDSNFYEDFPSNATTGEHFAGPHLGMKFDGVISIDYYTVSKMLELTGPIAVPGYPLTVDANTFVPQLIKYDLAGDPVRKSILGSIAGPLMNRVATLPPDRWPALISALNSLSASRNLQAYFNNDSVEKEVVRVGWSGTVNPTNARDYVMEIESNLGATKANYFVTRHFTVELTRNGSTLHHKVTIDITDNMPFEYRPMEYYFAYLRLYVSGTASSTRSNLRPPKYPGPPPPQGIRMIDGWVPLFHGYGHSAEAVFEYDTPWIANGRGEGQLYWQKQPGTLSDKVDVRWHDGSGHTYTNGDDLAQDVVITFSPRTVTLSPGHPAQAQLPSLSLG